MTAGFATQCDGCGKHEFHPGIYAALASDAIPAPWRVVVFSKEDIKHFCSADCEIIAAQKERAYEDLLGSEAPIQLAAALDALDGVKGRK